MRVIHANCSDSRVKQLLLEPPASALNVRVIDEHRLAPFGACNRRIRAESKLEAGALRTPKLSDVGTLFGLGEYEAAAAAFVGSAINDLMRAKDPLLGMIPSREVDEVIPSRTSIGGETIDTPPAQMAMELEVSLPDAVAGDAHGLYVAIDKAADQGFEQLMPHFFVLREVWRLSTWYLELAILNVIDYSGTYGNRLLSERWVGEVERVPWAD